MTKTHYISTHNKQFEIATLKDGSKVYAMRSLCGQRGAIESIPKYDNTNVTCLLCLKALDKMLKENPMYRVYVRKNDGTLVCSGIFNTFNKAASELASIKFICTNQEINEVFILQTYNLQ